MIESSNLKGAAAKGLFWSAMDRFGGQGIQFVFGILITRILLPADYGLVGMILIFWAVGQTLVDSGFGSALIWKKNPTPADYSTVFYFNVSISLILYLIFYLLAPLIAGFYDEPKLIGLIRVLCLNFILLSFGLIQQVVLQKKVDFKLLSFVNVASSLVAGIVALYMAMKGFGPWAIVVQILAKSFVTSLLLWIFNRWRPVFIFDWLSLKELFGYGSKLTAAGLIYNIFQYLYLNIIGKLFPVEALGFYTRASQLQDFPVKTLGSVFNRVAFPVFSAIQDDNERLKNAVRKTLRTMVFFNFPMLLGLVAVSDPLIEVVLTEKWLPASEYFKLLCLIGLFYSFQLLTGEIMKTKGRSDLVLKYETINRIITLISVIVTWRWGISAIILGQLFTSVFAWLLGSYYVWKLIGYSLWQQTNDVFIYFILSVSMYLFMLLVSALMTNHLAILISASVSGIIFYLILSWKLKLNELAEIRKYYFN
jgi:O-antigen/teichoic acid export membrane protein